MLSKFSIRTKPKFGFTLIELMAVIAIFSMIAAIMIPTLQPATRVTLKRDISDSPMRFSQSSDPLSLGEKAEEYFTMAPDERPPMVALQGGDTLVLFDADTPGDIVSRPITGLNPGEEVLAFDTQLETSNLYGVTNHNRLVRITASTGAAVTDKYLGAGLNDSAFMPIATMYNFYVDSGGVYESNTFPYDKWIRSDVPNSFGNNWFFILPSGELYEWDGLTEALDGNLLARVGANAYENPELLGGASATAADNPAGALAADNTRHFYRSSTGNYAYNAMGGNEKWIKGELVQKSLGAQNNPWYFIMPNGDVREWDGTEGLSGNFVGNYGVGVYEKPSLLYDANLVNATNSGGLDQTHRFFFDRFEGSVRNLYEGTTPGDDVKWFAGDNNEYFFIRTNGDIHMWDGSENATGPLLGNVGLNGWDNIEQIVNDYHDATFFGAVNLDVSLSICRDSADENYFFDSGDLLEKWLRCDPSAKSIGQNNPWLFILPNGDIVEWDGSGEMSGNVIGNFPQAYDDPNWLCDAYADGTVMSNPHESSYSPPPGSVAGDRLNLGGLSPSTGVGADMLPVYGYLTIVMTNNNVISINVNTGLTSVHVDITDIFTNAAAIAHNHIGNRYILDNRLGGDRLSFYQSGTGNTANIGNLGVNTNHNMGLEIIGDGIPGTGDTLAAMEVGGASRLYQIDIATGAAVLLGDIGVGIDGITDLTVNHETP